MPYWFRQVFGSFKVDADVMKFTNFLCSMLKSYLLGKICAQMISELVLKGLQITWGVFFFFFRFSVTFSS